MYGKFKSCWHPRQWNWKTIARLPSFARVLWQVLLLRSCKLCLPPFIQSEHRIIVEYGSALLTPKFAGLTSLHQLSLPNQKLI